MSVLSNSFKRTVAAFLLTSSLSGSGLAQDGPETDLFQQLLEADQNTHEAIANRIVGTWVRSGSPAMDLLYRRGEDALEADDPRAAVEHFTALVDHAPDFAEGYHARASAYFAMDLIGPALDDLLQVLVMEPQHFQAMFGFGAILESLDRPEEALEVYNAVLDIYPLYPQAIEGVERLKLELEGQSL